MKLVYKTIGNVGSSIWRIGEKLAEFGDSMVSRKLPSGMLSDEQLKDYLERPFAARWRVKIGQKMAKFGDYLGMDVGRHISFWAYGKLHNDCFAKAPKGYLYDMDLPPQDKLLSPCNNNVLVPGPKYGCEAQTGCFIRTDCKKPEGMSWEDFIEQEKQGRVKC